MVRTVIGVMLAVIVLVALLGWLYLRGPDIPYAQLEAKYAADPAAHFVDLPGGYHVHYRDEGKADGPVLLLLHGYGDSFTSWEGWVKVLKDRYRLVSVDFPGHGLTRAPAATALDAVPLADYLDTFAAALKLPPVAVAGNSMGGGVAWQFALRHPARVRALILVDAAGFPNDKPPGEVPLAFKILQYRWGRTLLRNIDNRPLIREGLKTDVYDKALITRFVVDRWAEFQRAPGHRAILMNMNPRAQRAGDAGTAGRHQGADTRSLGRGRPADRAGGGAKIRRRHRRRQAHHLSRRRPSAADRDPAALRPGRGRLPGHAAAVSGRWAGAAGRPVP